MEKIVAPVCGTLVVIAICGSALYGCQRASDDYYKFANECVKSGGSWIITGQTNYNGLCINPNKEQK